MQRLSKPIVLTIVFAIAALLPVAITLGLIWPMQQAEPIAAVPAPDYWPTDGWQTSTPEAQGMDSQQLLAMVEHIEEGDINLHSLMVIRHGYVVMETYFQPHQPTDTHQIMSVTKSVTATLVGIAVDQGHIESIDQSVLSYFPDRTIQNVDSSKEGLTLRHLLTLTTGMECGDIPTMEQNMQQSDDWLGYLLDIPIITEPGSSWFYCSQAVHILSAVLQQATGISPREFANEHLFKPLGIDEVTESQWEVDTANLHRGDVGLRLTPRDMAKLGYLYLRGGLWDGKQVVSSEWIAAATTSQVPKDDGNAYGYLWTVYPQESHYAALGLGGQEVHVLPSYDMVVVTTAAIPMSEAAQDIEALLDTYIVPAVKQGAALTANPQAEAALISTSAALAAPQALPVSIPELAYAISDRTYVLDPNPLGWEQLTPMFVPDSDTATLILNASESYPLGLDGRFRMSESTSGVPQALRGEWISSTTFRVELIEIGSFNNYVITLTFAGDEVELVVVDTTMSSLNITIHGKAED